MNNNKAGLRDYAGIFRSWKFTICVATCKITKNWSVWDHLIFSIRYNAIQGIVNLYFAVKEETNDSYQSLM